jgi:uncharacterized membrane protein
MRTGPSRLLHEAFEASLILKGLFALVETLSGLGLYFIGNATIKAVVDWLTRNELVEDPGDLLARAAMRAAEGLSVDTQHFFAFYMASHGVVKLAMVAALAARVTWAYPVSIVVLFGFIAYQVHRYMVSPSVALILLTVFDLVVIALIWREYRAMPERRA